ncbi:hypothetical protein LCGC14_2560700, partial [marine sediment metagenome]
MNDSSLRTEWRMSSSVSPGRPIVNVPQAPMSLAWSSSIVFIVCSTEMFLPEDSSSRATGVSRPSSTAVK